MVQYDEKIIQEYAENLYIIADRIVFWAKLKYGIIWGIVLGIIGGVFGIYSLLDQREAGVMIGSSLAGFIIGGIIGVKRGKIKGEAEAFEYRLKAQTALCQVKIEQNTRKD
ncbi:MAG: hypothetical protein ACP5SD_09170 [Elusimicrobiales bacterium]